jgi:hypothetical protein
MNSQAIPGESKVSRIAVPKNTQEQVILLSRRRCCVCFGLSGEIDVKAGQIAHLDHDNKNNDLDNLAFLCLRHHDEYDSKGKQSKGLLENELKRFRTELHNNVSAALSRAEEKFLELFGNDDESAELTEWFERLQTTALTQTASVQCLGMRKPLPFDNVYQPTRVIVAPDEDDATTESYSYGDRVSRSILRGRAFNEKSITVEEFLRRDQDALIFSGPGWGKTTFVHHIFRITVKDDNLLPVLITLRRPNAIDDLEKYVEACSKIQKKQHRACSLLLVDGYDEVSTEQRRRVSEALLRYQARRVGKFYLTCREYYQVSQLKAPEVRLEAFTRDDQVRFVRVFLSGFAVIRQDAEVVVSQLEERGFAEFLSHPLLLTLACIVKTSSTSAQPRSGLRLLQRALDVLCFQWDEQKNIDRQQSTRLDGRDRVTILQNIAFTAKSPYVPQQRAEETTRKQLALLGMDRVDPRQALMEIARFYGILVPAEDGYEFVHRTIHDFLAAQLWVESGEFAIQAKYEWNARAGYAACLIRDATDVLKQALAAPDGLPAATEIIGNSASFDMQAIADELIRYFSAQGRVLEHERRTYDEADRRYAPRITGRLDSDFIRLANSRFLDFLVEYCCEKKSQAADLLVAYAAIELYDRRLKLMHQTYEKALASYKTETFAFVVPGAKQAQLQFLNPVLKNRMKDFKTPAIEPAE